MERPFPHAGCCHTSLRERKRPCFLPCHGPVPGCKRFREPAPPCLSGARSSDPSVFTAAVARYRALERLREFRERLLGCLAARGDALFELADAVLCSDRPVRSLVQLSLEPEFRRGHGALYDALAAGRIDDERLFSLLTEVLPPLVDGPEARAWIAEHDVADRGPGPGAVRGPRGGRRQGPGRVRPLVPAPDSSRRDLLSPAGRLVLAGPRARPPRRLPLQGLVQDHARLGVPARRRHRAPAHRLGSGRRRPADDSRDTDRADGRPGQECAAPPAPPAGRRRFRLRRGLQRRRAHRRPPAARPTSWSASRPAASSTTRPPGPARTAARAPRAGSPLPGAGSPRRGGRGQGSRGRKRPLPPAPEPDEELILPDTPLYGTVRAEAWHDVHPQVHGDRGWFAGRDKLPVLRGTLVHVTAERLPDGRDPHRHLALARRPGPLSTDELWRCYLARFDIEHAISSLKGTLGLTAAKVRTPEQADRWARVVIAAHAQLLLARPLAGDLRRPWEKPPDASRPLAPGRVRRGFRNIRLDWAPRPCRETFPPRPRQAQRKQQRTRSTSPSPR